MFKIVIKLYTTNRIRQIGTNDGWLEYHRYFTKWWLDEAAVYFSILQKKNVMEFNGIIGNGLRF